MKIILALTLVALFSACSTTNRQVIVKDCNNVCKPCGK